MDATMKTHRKITKRRIIFPFALLGIVCSSLLCQSHAATYNISITEDGFDPAYLEVQLGDTVNWWNDDSFADTHTTRSYNYPWYSGIMPWGTGVSLTASKLGEFPYIDDLTGDTGTLVIKSPTPPPPPPPGLAGFGRLPDGSFQFSVTGLVVNKTNVIQASIDLVNWIGIQTNVSSSTNN